MLISKEEFLECISFIKTKRAQEVRLANVFEEICPGCFCDTLIYSEYENTVLKLLRMLLDDENDLIGYKLYEFDELSTETKAGELKETPEVETWETVYDYLVKNRNKK